MQSTLSRRPRAVYTLRAWSLLAYSPLAFVCGPREARGNASLRSGLPPPSAAADCASRRRQSRASRGGASLRSAWLSSAGAYPIRVCYILALVDNLGSQTTKCVVPWSSLRSSYFIGALDDQVRQKSLWHISVCARWTFRSV